MKRTVLRILSGLIAAVLCFGAAGCNTSGGKKVYMNYATGLGDDLQYNNKLYGLNGSNDKEGADPGCIYISVEEDPDWGGYYYLYQGGTTSVQDEDLLARGIDNIGISCFRSKDLYQWEGIGTIRKGGYVLELYTEDWPKTLFYAPEVIRNPKDGKYYLYFNASAAEDWGVESMSSSSNPYDRFHLGVAVSDTPIGPFHMIYDVDEATGKRMPTINFHTGCNTAYPWAAIDVSPFFDDNGDFYLYFNKHSDDHYSHLNGIWGMKMKSMSEPDYSTVSCLTAPGKVTASSVPGKIEESFPGEEKYYDPTESGINEAPFMIKHNGKYYLTYASNGFGNVSYSVHQAVSDSPLSGFRKLSLEEGNPVLNGAMHGYMNGTAHHALMRNGDELWIVYHKHNTLREYWMGRERSIAVDRCNFVTNADGLDVLTANGPSMALQWLPESVSGYRNLAKTATIEVDRGTGKEYLTDTVLPFYAVTADHVLSSEKGDVTVTLKWEEPVSVTSLMIYNAYDVNKAFSKVADIRFKLAETPAWASEPYDYAVIQDAEVPKKYWDPSTKVYIQCSPVVTEFEPIMVTEISFTIREGDRLAPVDKLGNLQTGLNLSEVVVLGGVK
ncbi:MAG: family 43 glycosylhydrolase [Lachnospiraceae bacterium]|nr:family 43 glycosylhydrolase [Lachnospiraceae bacterium]